ncbi:MAG: ribonuclease P [Candidatus Aenigmarchaeota archaeon]|nr:ribonuclease P [Candidatus Aenigmarchaeota archaeon]
MMRKKIFSMNKKMNQKIAKERIRLLFSEAEGSFPEHPERSKRFIELARKIGTRHNVTLSAEMKKRFCKECGEYLVPGNNCIVRLDSEKKNIVIKCKKCGSIKRYPYKSRKDKK